MPCDLRSSHNPNHFRVLGFVPSKFSNRLFIDPDALPSPAKPGADDLPKRSENV